MKNKNRPYKITRRRRFIQKHIDTATSKMLEAGALDCPTFCKDEAMVKFMDWYTTDEIQALVSRGSKRQKEEVCEVDYPVKSKYFSDQIPQSFDLFIANHVIEHVPDVISWLQEIEKVLVPGGHVFLSIPDRRYTFDFLRRETTVTDLLRCHDLDLEKPDAWQTFDAIYFRRNIVREDIDNSTYKSKLELKPNTLKEALVKAKIKEKSYVSLHCSVFSYPGFDRLYNDLLESGLVSLKLIKTRDVLPNGQEFHVLLQKS